MPNLKPYKGDLKMRNSFFIIPILIFVTLSTNCEKEESSSKAQINKSTSADATSTASQKSDSWLPEVDTTYKIIGYKKGLKGVTIEYNPNMFRGGNILSAEGAKFLQENGIKTVISVTPDDNIKTLCNTFQISNVNMFYDYGKLSDSVTVSFLNLLDDKNNYPVYIHCFSGKQRAGLLCAIARIYKENWSFEKAEAEYNKLGGKVNEDHQLLIKANELIQERRKTQA